MLRYPAMIPAAPKISSNQGSVPSHPSSQLPIRKPTTTERPSSIPIELNITHRVFFAGHFIKPPFLNVSDLADYADAFHIARVLELEELFVKREPGVVKFLNSFHKTPYG
jgi:hypothetical protein